VHRYYVRHSPCGYATSSACLTKHWPQGSVCRVCSTRHLARAADRARPQRCLSLLHLFNTLVSNVQGCWLGGRGSIPAGVRFSVLHKVQTSSGVHPTSYTMGIGGPFAESKAAGAWSWPLTSIQYRDQEQWSYISTPLYVFMVWCLIM
jgi:hypothetical protein